MGWVLCESSSTQQAAVPQRELWFCCQWEHLCPCWESDGNATQHSACTQYISIQCSVTHQNSHAAFSRHPNEKKTAIPLFILKVYVNKKIFERHLWQNPLDEVDERCKSTSVLLPKGSCVNPPYDRKCLISQHILDCVWKEAVKATATPPPPALERAINEKKNHLHVPGVFLQVLQREH